MAAESIDDRLARLGIVLPEASNPAAEYTNFIEVNGLLFVSGKGPVAQNGVKPKGKLGQEYTTADGYQFAWQTGIEILAVVKSGLGSLERIKRVVKIQGFVNATPQFEEHHKVLNGCSELLVAVLGEKGVHTRSVLGAVSVRDNLPIIIDSIFAVE
jgi:enamine deaminase RidA (YjgF/YER057c/UK114 family)